MHSRPTSLQHFAQLALELQQVELSRFGFPQVRAKFVHRGSQAILPKNSPSLGASSPAPWSRRVACSRGTISR
jgi:hypothetical protein